MNSISVFCPQCKKSTAYNGNPFRPFCSERCKLIDFGAWAQESYAIASDDSSFETQQQTQSGEEK